VLTLDNLTWREGEKERRGPSLPVPFPLPILLLFPLPPYLFFSPYLFRSTIFSFSFDLFPSHSPPLLLTSFTSSLYLSSPSFYFPSPPSLYLSSFPFLPVSVPSPLLPWFNSPALSFTLFLSFFSFLVLFQILSFPCLSFLPLSVCLFCVLPSFSSPFHPPFYFLSLFLSPSLNISPSFCET
jgi:hypothetical protein